jgi:5-methylcytosine-specific restriction protein A
MALSDLTTSAVAKAIEEFDQLGRDSFLRKYGFGRARSYVLQRDGHSYDSKAIAGAAHGYLPDRAPLKPNEFSGGEATVATALEQLGFTVVEKNPESLPSPGDVLGNEQIGRRFGVGNMGGMRRSKGRNLLVLISDPFKGLYQDRWEGEVLHYTGMGPSGPQSLNYAQNRTLAESTNTGIAVHLLEALEPQKYTYVGEVELAGAPYEEEQLDDEGQARNVWMFPIKLKGAGAVPILTNEQARLIEQAQAQIARRLPMEQLLARAKQAKKQPAIRTAQASAFVRNAAVAEYVKRLANGLCDLCERPAPFQNRLSEAYLECHHIIWLAKGGEDIITNAVALCPNCHRKMHVLNKKTDKKKLTKRVGARVAY